MVFRIRCSIACYIILCSILLSACTYSPSPVPPSAKIQPDTTFIHGDTLVDNYSWLKDKTRTNPDVISYLEEENNYTENMLHHTQPLQEKLFQEIVSRIPEKDVSVPTQIDDYYYYFKEEKEKQYWQYCRKHLDAEQEEVLLDANELAKGHEYFWIDDLSISPAHNFLAYTVDTTGAERYTLYIKDLEGDSLLKDTAFPVSQLVWAEDNINIFYTTDDEAGRSNKLFRHTLGALNNDCLFEEPDDAFYLWLYKTRSEKYIILGSGSKTTTELWFLDAQRPLDQFTCINPRMQGIEYYVAHHGDEFFICTNADEAKNFKIMKTPVSSSAKDNWREFIPHRDSVYISGFDAFADYLVLHERIAGLEHLRIINIASKESHYVDFPEPAYVLYGSANPIFATNTYRFSYESFVTPYTVYDYNMHTRELEIKKQQEIQGGYEPTLYTSERIFAQADDGTMIPISLVYKDSLFLHDGTNPLLLYGYGAYGEASEPYFSISRLSLIDRGFVYAIAHVRGGGELGKEWYDQGKLLNKKNTFTDFIACAKHLINANYTNREKLVIEGASAGGMLIGAVLNMEPSLFKAVIADVPFVDVLNTMLDPSLTATVSEYEEWGNPYQKVYYDYIKSYCPYQNVTAQEYPHILAVAGFYDTRVNYWEPAKWVAKIRDLGKDNHIILLKTNMSAGHSGASGRYDLYREIALKYAFLLDILNIE
ncbi:MAG: S9 family peptidase [Candidatus Cloacimonadia bacterium]